MTNYFDPVPLYAAFFFFPLNYCFPFSFDRKKKSRGMGFEIAIGFSSIM